MVYDLIVRNGDIIDPVESRRFVGDIGVADGKIAAIGGGHARGQRSAGAQCSRPYRNTRSGGPARPLLLGSRRHGTGPGPGRRTTWSNHLDRSRQQRGRYVSCLSALHHRAIASAGGSLAQSQRQGSRALSGISANFTTFVTSTLISLPPPLSVTATSLPVSRFARVAPAPVRWA